MTAGGIPEKAILMIPSDAPPPAPGSAAHTCRHRRRLPRRHHATAPSARPGELTDEARQLTRDGLPLLHHNLAPADPGTDLRQRHHGRVQPRLEPLPQTDVASTPALSAWRVRENIRRWRRTGSALRPPALHGALHRGQWRRPSLPVGSRANKRRKLDLDMPQPGLPRLTCATTAIVALETGIGATPQQGRRLQG